MVAAIVPLGCWAWLEDRERAAHEATYARLLDAAGDLEVADPSRAYFKAIPTGKPLRFAWRTYFPPDPPRLTGRGPASGSPNLCGMVGDGVFKISVRESEDGNAFEVSLLNGQGGGFHSFGDRSLVELLRGRWDRIEVEQAGATGPVPVAVDEPLTLLRLRIPPDILAEGRSKPVGLARTIPAVFYEFPPRPASKVPTPNLTPSSR